MSGTRQTRDFALDVTIEAPVDEVWRALATGEGLKRWFPFDARVDARPGGELWLSWGPDMEGSAPLSVVEPGRRLAWIEARQDEDGQPIELAVEFTLESRGHQTVVRVVNSGFGTSAAWDNEVDSISRGWLVFMRQLRFTLERHRGVDRRVVYAEAPVDVPVDEAWARLFSPEGFSLDGAPRGAEGGRLELTTADGDSLRGVVQVWNPPKDLAMAVESMHDAHLWVEIYPAPRARVVKLTLSLYGAAEPDPAALEVRWRERLRALYADVART
jgi:uncharacterized protein YndB with AHSA1/START domain